MNYHIPLAILLAGAAIADYAGRAQHDYLKTPQFMEWFDRAKIGDEFRYTIPDSDGCNICSGTVKKKTGKTVIDLGVYACTLRNCRVEFPEMEVK